MRFAEERAVLVTGVSTGIGHAIAKLLTAEGYHVFGTVRKSADADRLAGELGSSFTPLLLDITDENSIATAAAKVASDLKGKTLFGLVNNAGTAWAAPLMHQPLEDFRKILDANLIGTFLVTQAFLPQLGATSSLTGGPGRIINITSVGGKYGAPFMGAYAASKHAVEGMSDSLRRELMIYGIDVIVIGPGHVKTPIWEKAQSVDISAYANTDYAAALSRFIDTMAKEGQSSNHTPEHIAKSVLTALTTPAPWSRYAIVSKRLLNWTLPLSLPPRWVDKIMADAVGLHRIRPARKKD